MTTNIELYEALKPKVGEDGARLIAEALPQAADLATKADLRELEARLKADIRSWMLTFFVPLWVGVYATLGALIVSLVAKN